MAWLGDTAAGLPRTGHRLGRRHSPPRSHVMSARTDPCYARGRVTALDRTGIEERTCECDAVVKNEYDRLLPARTAI